ncbi:extracellular solute-binding protein [Mycetocola tolaasinivorans]|uniref:Extracellular solute-binding protein n=1 Tax=Mycetocola tolaasinivorans TaxID=76635 RepID=A0A3L7A6U2_9MICO|nr:extracellular solute-binding protein [Mycetocola tolaasinivorans]RLP76053.1 extracellular solute-binding protein [Mycetocola tolaasinivorans]
MKKRNLLTLIAGSAALALALTGCGSGGPGQTTGAATMWALTGDDTTVMKTSVETWNKEHSDLKIDFNAFAKDGFKPKLRTAIGAGEGPTFVFGWGGGVLADFVKAGQIEDLSDFVAENPEVLKRYIPSVLANGTVDGKTYAIPNNKLQPVVLYYNTAMFTDAGVTPPKTWDDLLDLVKTFNAKGIAPFSLGAQTKWPSLMWLQYLSDRIGGPEAFQAVLDGKPDAWSHPAIIEALTKIQQLVDAGGFINGFASVSSDSGADLALVHTGKAAMVLHGAWSYQTFKTDSPDFVKDGKLGYTTFPTVAGGVGDPKNIVGNPTNFWSISSKATQEQKKAALAYLADGLNNDAYVDDIIASGAVPVVQGVEAKLKSSDNADWLSFVYDMASNAPHFQLSWDQALPPAQGEAMLTNLEQIFLKKITPQEFATTMNATLGK